MPVPQLSKRLARALQARKLPLFLLALFALAVCIPLRSQATLQPAAATTASAEKGARREFVPGQILVRFRNEAAATAAVGKGQLSVETASAVTGESGEQIPVAFERLSNSAAAEIEGLSVARVAPEQTLRAVEALRSRADVLYAEPNYIRRKEAVPNDPLYPQQYALKNTGQSSGTVGADIKAESAWNLTTGTRGIVVGVIDEGVDISHPDLVNNIWTNPAEIPGNGVDDDGDGLVDDIHGWDFLNNDSSVYDGASISQHGTHVAGTIGAQGNNGQGVAGVNWQVTLLPLKFLGADGGADSDAIKAILYAKKLREMWDSSGHTKGANVRILNNSWGGGGNSAALRDAIQAANDAGILFVAAAGNEGTNNDSMPHYPSSYSVSNIIAVGATDRLDNPSYNYGVNSVHIAAPGIGIYSTMPGNSYGQMSGTSMATPHVSGVAALVLAANPSLSVQGVRSAILYNGDALASLTNRNFTGSRLSALGSVQAAAEHDTTPPGAVTNLRVTNQSGRTVTLEWIASGDDGAAGRASLYVFSFVDALTAAERIVAQVRPAASGQTQSITLNIPYRHTSGSFRLRVFDNVANEGPVALAAVSVSASISDPYTISKSGAQSLSTGGTPLNIDGDDKYAENYPLPFSFPFYGVKYSSVSLSSNGSIYFQTPPKRPSGNADDVPGSVDGLNKYKMISGMWDDLDLRKCFRTDADIYVVQPDSNRVIFRWQGVSFMDTDCPATANATNVVNFEIELQRTGEVITRYGSGNKDLNPVVGLSNGEPDAYVVLSHTSEDAPINLTNAQTVTFSTAPLCEYELAATHITLGPNAQTASVKVGALGGCTWTAASNVPWITIAAGTPGSGPGTLQYSVAVNNSNSPRTGTLTIAGQTVTVVQSAGPAPAQPADDAQFFVRMHYLDFLSREPDEDGLGYWSNEITRCGTDPVCLNLRRVNVSAAFFIEAEFRDTGSFIYRLYRAGLGRTPTYAEFSADRPQVVGGVNLEASKVAFANAFVQRQEFVNKYAGTGKSAINFVNLLVNTIRDSTGVDLSAQREDLVAVYDSSADVTESRSLTLRAAIEYASFKDAVYNPSFVLMQYFGYLHRDPEVDGYLFWLDVLNNKVPGNYRGMVCSFITSAEYQLRFGQTVTRSNQDCSSIR